MAQARKILLADPDLNAVRPLTRALRQRGYHVQFAGDGSKALEMAVLRHPDVILYDEACSFIDAKAFVRILQTNPRTDSIPIVVTSARRDSEQGKGRDGLLLKPFNLDEVTSRIDHLCRRVEAARELKGDTREIEGGLTQLPLVDLLQILAMNRRSGKLALTYSGERGEIFVMQGRPVQARHGEVEGEKALFRLLSWKDGSFAFAPAQPPPKTPIDRSMEDALLEGMRQADERERLLSTLPALRQVLTLSPGAPEVVDPHPVTAAVLKALEQPKRLAEVLDACEASDLEVLSAVAALLERTAIRAQEGVIAHDGPLLGAAEVHALRGRLLRGKPSQHALVSKVVVCGTGPKAGRHFLSAMAGLEASAKTPSCLRSSFGTLASLAVSDVLRVDFVLVPSVEAARPLWRPFTEGALGALVMEETTGVLSLARFCAFELRIPLVIVAGAASGGLVTSHSLPSSLRGAPLGAALVEEELSAAVRALLVSAIQVPSAIPEEGVRPQPRR